MGRARVLALLAAATAVAGCQQARPAAAPQAGAGSATSVTSGTGSSRTGTGTAPTGPLRSTAATTPAATTAPATAPAAKPATPKPPASGLPLSYGTGNAHQVITVTTAAYGDTRATVQAWTRTATGWSEHGAAVAAWLGYAGFSPNAREGFTGTPMGSFGLTQAFGNNADPGTRLPYFQADADDWWNGDSASAGYNTHQHCASGQCPFRTAQSENLHDAGWVYGYAVVIDYNTAPAVPGRGSAFFLHVTENHPTQGCVSIPTAPLVALLRWLDPAEHPRILMGLSRTG